ncbi:MAG: hypothetical protein CMQ05_12260 [Gammaproteobacteria bacterium]|nr:hypothetical protein [Gammaproteobacteria bacterium]
MFARLRVSRDLLQCKVPTSMIAQVHQGVQKSRNALETKVLERRKKKTTVTSNEKTELFGSI